MPSFLGAAFLAVFEVFDRQRGGENLQDGLQTSWTVNYYTQTMTNNLFGLYLLVRTGKEWQELSKKEIRELVPHFWPWVEREAL